MSDGRAGHSAPARRAPDSSSCPTFLSIGNQPILAMRSRKRKGLPERTGSPKPGRVFVALRCLASLAAPFVVDARFALGPWPLALSPWDSWLWLLRLLLVRETNSINHDRDFLASPRSSTPPLRG